MKRIDPPKLFPANRLKGVFSALGSASFVAVGFLCFCALGSHIFSYAFTILGCLGLVVTSCFLLQRIVVTQRGIQKKPGGSSVLWEEVESWSIEDVRATSEEDSFTRAALSFQICGHRLPTKIFDSDVDRPGIESLITEVRRYAQKKEKARGQSSKSPSLRDFRRGSR